MTKPQKNTIYIHYPSKVLDR